MANLFANETNNSKSSKKADLSTINIVPATCVAMQTAMVDNKFAKSEDESIMPVVRWLFHADVKGEVVSKWTPWVKIMPMSVAVKSKAYGNLFQGDEGGELEQSDVIEHCLDTDWMFSHAWLVQGAKGNNGYVNLGKAFYNGDIGDGSHSYDLAGYPPFNTAKYYGKSYPVHEMYVRLEDGSCHKVEEAEFKVWEDKA